MNVIAGITFLGTPHRLEGVDVLQFGQRILSILKLDESSTLPRQVLSRLKESASLFRDVAVRYDKTNLRVDTLSVYETRTTKIRDGAIILKSKKLIVRKDTRRAILGVSLTCAQIVDEQLCSIDTPLEVRLGLPLDHLQLPTLTDADGMPCKPIELWFASVIDGALKNLESRLQRRMRNPFSKAANENY